MSITVADIIGGLGTQQLPALVAILNKAKEFSTESGIAQNDLLETRLHEDMHPLMWQFQTALELSLRGLARLSGTEPPEVSLEGLGFDGIIDKVNGVKSTLDKLDIEVINQSEEKMFEIPAGPDTSISLSGKDYLLKFLLPNFYFHMTTAYALLRMRGVPVGKRDFLGPVS